MKELIADGFRERCAEHGDRGREHHARLVAAADQPDGIEQHPRAVEIDPVTLVEIEFRLARNDRRQVENHVGATRDQLFGGARDGKIGGDHIDRKSWLVRLGRRHDIVQGQAGDIACAEAPVTQQPLGQFAADHAGGTQNQNVQEPSPSC